MKHVKIHPILLAGWLLTAGVVPSVQRVQAAGGPVPQPAAEQPDPQRQKVRTERKQERHSAERNKRSDSTDRSALRAERRHAADSTVRGAVLTLNEVRHDFGDVPRKGGDLTCEIGFTNTGDTPLVVTRLITSNSCLKASCSRRPVAPGGKGVIRIVYQPIKSEAGAFNRIVQICSNAAAGTSTITVSGNSFDAPLPERKVKWIGGRQGKTKLKVK